MLATLHQLLAAMAPTVIACGMDSRRFGSSASAVWKALEQKDAEGRVELWNIKFPKQHAKDFDAYHMSSHRVVQHVIKPLLRGIAPGSKVLIVGDSTTHYPCCRHKSYQKQQTHVNAAELAAYYSFKTRMDVWLGSYSGTGFTGHYSISEQIYNCYCDYWTPDVILIVGGWNDRWASNSDVIEGVENAFALIDLLYH